MRREQSSIRHVWTLARRVYRAFLMFVEGYRACKGIIMNQSWHATDLPRVMFIAGSPVASPSNNLEPRSTSSTSWLRPDEEKHVSLQDCDVVSRNVASCQGAKLSSSVWPSLEHKVLGSFRPVCWWGQQFRTSSNVKRHCRHWWKLIRRAAQYLPSSIRWARPSPTLTAHVIHETRCIII